MLRTGYSRKSFGARVVATSAPPPPDAFLYVTLLFRSLNGTGNVYGGVTSGQRTTLRVSIGGGDSPRINGYTF